LWDDTVVLSYSPTLGSWHLQILDSDTKRWQDLLTSYGVKHDGSTAGA
jgi:hypothetical protein